MPPSKKGLVIAKVDAPASSTTNAIVKVEEVKKMEYKDIEEMLGISLSSARKKCAYLAYEVLKKLL